MVPHNFKIYQIKDIENCNYAFMDFIPKQFNPSDYQMELEGNIQSADRCLDEDLLEELFDLFNHSEGFEKYPNFHGHSLSTSDVVVIDGRAWYCDRFAWTRLKDYDSKF